MDLATIYKPSDFHLEKIKEYILKKKTRGSLNSVEKSFKRNELIVLFKEKELIGFSAYESDYPVSKINVFEIVEKHRHNGLGKKLAKTTLKEIEKRKEKLFGYWPLLLIFYGKKLDLRLFLKQ